MIHHTGISTSYMPEQLRAVENSHSAKGYSESPFTGEHVCYNFFVGSDGTWKQLRGLHEKPGCTMNEEINNQSVQIVLAGNFQPDGKGFPGDIPSRHQIASLKLIVTALQEKLNIPKENVIGHRDASDSSCPGENLVKMLWPNMQ